MIDNFAEWMRTANKAPSGELITARLAGITELMKDPSTELRAQEAALLVTGEYDDSDETYDAFREAFRATDAAFIMRNNQIEMRILTGSLLAALYENKEHHSTWLDKAALLVCSSMYLIDQEQPYREFFELSNRYLAARAEAMRGDSSIMKLPSPKSKVIKTTELTTFAQQNSFQNGGPLIVDAFKSVQADIEAIFTRHHRLSEESNTLWWLVGGYSETLGQQLETITWIQALLPSTLELMRLTPFGLLTPNAAFFLARFLNQCKEQRSSLLSVEDFVVGAKTDWIEKDFFKKVEDEVSVAPTLYPVSFCLLKFSELKGNAVWKEQVSSEIRFDLSKNVDSLNLIRQLIYEVNALFNGEFLK